MIVQNSESTQINGKDRGKQLHAIYNPLAAVFEVKAAYRVIATQKGATYTT